MYRSQASSGATVSDPALFPIENPNPVFRAAANGLILFANPASDGLLASWDTYVGNMLPVEWQQHVADSLDSNLRQRVSAPCGDLVYELDLVPNRIHCFVNFYGRDVTEQEAVRHKHEGLLDELRREHDLQQVLMENSSASLIYLDRDFNFVRMNRAYEVACQRSRAEMLGRNHFELFPNPENEAIFRRVRDTGQPVEFRAKPFEFADQPWRGVTYWDWILTPVIAPARPIALDPQIAPGTPTAPGPQTAPDPQVEGLVFSLLDVTEQVRAQRLSDALHDIHAAIASRLEFGEIIQTALAKSVAALGCDGGVVGVREDSAWITRYAAGMVDQLPGTAWTDAESPATVRAAITRQPVAILEGENTVAVEGEVMARYGERASLFLPLIVRDEVIGVLAFNYNRPRAAFTEAELDFARRLATVMCLTLENARVLELESRERELAEVRASELEATLEAINDGVLICDRAGKYVRQNVAALRMLGYQPADGQLPIAMRAARLRAVLVDEPDAGVERMPLSRALCGETVRDQLMRMYPIDQPEGPARYLLVGATPIRDTDGAQSGAVISFSDVTELLRARDELAQRVEELQTLLELLPTGVAISYDLECKDIRANPALAKMLAAPPLANVSLSADASQREVQYRVLDHAGRELTVEDLPMQAAARGVEVRDRVIEILREDGATVTLLSYAVPLLDAKGERRGAVGAYVDISQLRAAEVERERLLSELQARSRELGATNEEIRALNASLEQRVQERTAELEAIFASLPDAVYIGNKNGIYRCNAAALSYLGCNTIEDLWDAIPVLADKVQTRYGETGERVPPDREPFVRALQGEPVTEDLLLRNLKTGRDMLVRSACAPIWLNGAVLGGVAINTDITQQKQVERELRISREQLKKLSHRLVELQESERSHVAKELYDDQGQRLAALHLELIVMARNVAQNAVDLPALYQRITRMKDLVSSLLADMHHLAVDLRPASLDRLGLMAGLRHYAEKLGQERGLNIEVEATGLSKLTLGPDAETMLYRIAQEAVTNAVHHSRASYIGISVVQHQKRVIVVIEDNGQGFDVAEVTRSGGLGLLGMRERAEMLGGSLTIESTPGQGTVVSIEAPVMKDGAYGRE